MRRPVALLAALAIGLGSPSWASDATESGAEAGDTSLEYKEPLGLSLLAGAVAAAAVPAAFYKTPPACRWCDGATPNALDQWVRKAKWEEPCRAVELSYLSLGLAGAVALLPMSRESSGREWLVNTGAVADAAAATVMLTQLVKYTVRRERPEADPCHPERSRESDRNLSFFSGHTAIAFALVSSAQETARLRGRSATGWLWVGGGAAAATAYFRVAGGRHHLIDVVAGAGVGYLVGRWVPRHVTRPRGPDSMAPIPAAGSLAPPAFIYSRPLRGDGSALLQVGAGPGRSLQLGLRF